MKKHSIINSIILGGSLMVSIGVISLASINAADPGNNSGVWKPINESPIDQAKEGGLTAGSLTTSGGSLTIKNSSNTSDVASINNTGIISGTYLSSTGSVAGNQFLDTTESTSFGGVTSYTYYLNPSSTSNLNSLRLNGNSTFRGNNLNIYNTNVKIGGDGSSYPTSNLDIYSRAKLYQNESQINTVGLDSLVNKRYVDNSINNEINSSKSESIERTFTVLRFKYFDASNDTSQPFTYTCRYTTKGSTGYATGGTSLVSTIPGTGCSCPSGTSTKRIFEIDLPNALNSTSPCPMYGDDNNDRRTCQIFTSSCVYN